MGRIERIIALQEKISATALMIDVDILSPQQQVFFPSTIGIILHKAQ